MGLPSCRNCQPAPFLISRGWRRCSRRRRPWRREVGTFPHFRERCESLQAEALAEIAVSSRPMSVEGEAQVKAASGEDYDRLAMGSNRRGDRGRLRADFHGPPRPARH